jgi:hypothetical protein
VLVKKRRVMRGDADAEDADVRVFQHEMMVGFVRDGNGDRSLSAERKCEQEPKKQVQSEPPENRIAYKALRSEERFLSAQADLPQGAEGKKMRRPASLEMTGCGSDRDIACEWDCLS